MAVWTGANLGAGVNLTPAGTLPPADEERRRQETEQKMQAFRDEGAGDDLAAALVSDNQIVRGAAHAVMSGLQRGKDGIVLNGAQVNDLAQKLFTPGANGLTMLDEAYQYFGEGTPGVISSVLKSHAASGADSRAFSTMLGIAKGMSQATGSVGTDLASRVTSGYRNLAALALGTSQYDKPGDESVPPGFNSVLASRQLMFDAVLDGAVSALGDRGVEAFNLFENPGAQQRFLEVMDVAARSQALGVSLPVAFSDTGLSFKSLAGRHIVGGLTDSPDPGNQVSQLSAFLTALGGIRGGPDATATGNRRSGNPAVYEETPDNLLMAKSSTRGCDDLALAAARGLYRAVSKQALAQRFTPGQVIEDAMEDTKGLGHSLVKEMASEMEALVGGRDVARLVAAEVLSEFSRTGQASVRDIVTNLALFDHDFERDHPKEAKSLRAWARYNAVYAPEVAGMRRDLETHFLDVTGDKSMAQALTAQVLQKVGAAERNGADFMAPYHNAMDTVNYYEAVVDEHGRPYKDPQTGVRQWRLVTGNARLARKKAGISEEKFMEDQGVAQREVAEHKAEMKRLRDRQAALEDYAARQQIAEEAKQRAKAEAEAGVE